VTQVLAFKGGVMDGAAVSAEQIGAIARLPARHVLHGQLVGLVASPIGGLVRTLNALIGGIAIQLGGVLEKKQSGEVPAGEPPAAAESAASEESAAATEESPAASDESAAATEEPPAASEEPAEPNTENDDENAVGAEGPASPGEATEAAQED
jgi:large subunit ribosomal protein L10